MNMRFCCLLVEILSLIPLLAASLWAQGELAEESERPLSIAAALREVQYLNKIRPHDRKPKVYFFITSHPLCPPCYVMAGELNDIYKKMRGRGGELIVCCLDRNKERVTRWMNESDAIYPIVAYDGIPLIPVPNQTRIYGNPGRHSVLESGDIPSLVAVNPKGEMLAHASGRPDCLALLNKWKDCLKPAKRGKEKGGDAVLRKLQDVKYLTESLPKKADVYFFVRKPADADSDSGFIKMCNELYADMKKKKVELILLGSDYKEEETKNWVEAEKLKFPVVSPDSAWMVYLPSGKISRFPHVVAVTPTGRLIEKAIGVNESRALLEKWKTLLQTVKQKKKEKRNSTENGRLQ